MKFTRPSDVIEASALGRTQYYAEVLEELRTPFIKRGRASLKPAVEAELEERAIAAGLLDDQRRELVALMLSWRVEALDESEAIERGVSYIRAAAKENAKAQAA